MNSLIQITLKHLDSPLLQPLLHMLIILIGNYRFAAHNPIEGGHDPEDEDDVDEMHGLHHPSLSRYSDFTRSRTQSMSSVGSVSHSTRSNPILHRKGTTRLSAATSNHSLTNHSAADTDFHHKQEDAASSVAPTVNLAWSVLNQLIK